MAKPNVPRTATVISGKLTGGKDNATAQIVVDKGIFAANADGAGFAIDKGMFEVGASEIRITPSKFIEIWDTPLNKQLIHAEKLSKEVADPLRLNRYAGEVLWGFPTPHSHLYPHIYVPSTYQSKTLNQLRKVKNQVSNMSPIGDALDGKVTTLDSLATGTLEDTMTQAMGKAIEPLGNFSDGVLNPLSWKDVIKDAVIEIVKETFDLGSIF